MALALPVSLLIFFCCLDPYTFFVITPNQNYDIIINFNSKEEKENLMKYQGRFVEIKGLLRVVKRIYPNSKYNRVDLILYISNFILLD